MTPAPAYPLALRVLHWTMAAGIGAMLALGLALAETTPRPGTLWLYPLHKSLGLSLLILALLRLGVRRMAPPPPPQGSARLRRAARAGHAALYLLMLAVPVAGWVASDATGIATRFWGIVLPPVVRPSATLDRVGFTLHATLAALLAALVAGHAAMALWHARRPGDDTMRRIWRKR